MTWVTRLSTPLILKPFLVNFVADQPRFYHCRHLVYLGTNGNDTHLHWIFLALVATNVHVFIASCTVNMHTIALQQYMTGQFRLLKVSFAGDTSVYVCVGDLY